MILKHDERSAHADARASAIDAPTHLATPRPLAENRDLDALIDAIMPLEVSGEPPETNPTRT